jgi:hypothetical protein
VQIYTANPDRSEAVGEAQRWLAEIGGRGAYVNYIDPEMSDWAEAYYGSNLPRLQHVARRYDLDRVFTFPQHLSRA